MMMGRQLEADIPAAAVRDESARMERDRVPSAIGPRLGRLAEFADDAVVLLLVVLLIPFAILLVGLPIVLVVRTLVEIVQRLH
jgi:hypothetical protein